MWWAFVCSAARLMSLRPGHPPTHHWVPTEWHAGGWQQTPSGPSFAWSFQGPDIICFLPPPRCCYLAPSRQTWPKEGLRLGWCGRFPFHFSPGVSGPQARSGVQVGIDRPHPPYPPVCPPLHALSLHQGCPWLLPLGGRAGGSSSSPAIPEPTEGLWGCGQEAHGYLTSNCRSSPTGSRSLSRSPSR